jgi:hypothetical protein
MPAPLALYKSVTLDGAGNGQVQLGPVPTYSSWAIERLAVQASGGTGTNQAQCRVYRGDAGAASMEDSTYAGNLDTAEYGNPIRLQTGEYLTVAWSGGRPGASATARAVGYMA